MSAAFFMVCVPFPLAALVAAPLLTVKRLREGALPQNIRVRHPAIGLCHSASRQQAHSHRARRDLLSTGSPITIYLSLIGHSSPRQQYR